LCSRSHAAHEENSEQAGLERRQVLKGLTSSANLLGNCRRL